MAAAVFPDNTVLCNFAAVHRLDLLEAWLRGRGRWTEAVANEARRSSRALPDLTTLPSGGWLGEPIELDGDEVAARIEHIRRDVFGGTRDAPLQHLGEAQTCWLLKESAEWREAWWVSDDRDALDFARKQGITTRETLDIMSAIVADGDLTAQQGHLLMLEMVSADRQLRLPKTPGGFQ